jgi:hypothetical protein
MTKSEAAMVKRGEHARLEAIADRVLAGSRRVAAKRAPRVKADRFQALRDHDAHLRLVAQVMARPGPECELGCHDGAEGVDPHHLEMGANKRRNERMSNVIRACRECHDAYHINAGAFLAAVMAWCSLHGYPLPNRRIFREPAPTSSGRAERE